MWIDRVIEYIEINIGPRVVMESIARRHFLGLGSILRCVLVRFDLLCHGGRKRDQLVENLLMFDPWHVGLQVGAGLIQLLLQGQLLLLQGLDVGIGLLQINIEPSCLCMELSLLMIKLAIFIGSFQAFLLKL